MTSCAYCGGQLAPGARSCASCGSAVAAPVVAGPGAPPTATTSAAVPSSGALAMFGRGDWTGALLANAVGVAAMAALAVAPAVNGGIDASMGISAQSSVAAVFLYVAMAAGGSASMAAGWLGSIDYSYRPLSITLVGYGLLAWLVLRRLHRGGATAGVAGRQALRVALVHGAALVAVALLSGVGSSPTGNRVPFGDGDVDPSFTWSADLGSTLFNGMLTLAVALVVAAVLGLPGVFPSFERLRVAIAGPVRSLAFLTIASCVVAMIAILALVLVRGERLVDESLPFTVPIQPDMALPNLAFALVGLLIMAPNLAAYALLFGMGVPLTTAGGLSFTGEPQPLSILDETRENGWLWCWPAVVLGLLVATGWYAARWSGRYGSGRRGGVALGLVLPVALLLLARAVGISATMSGFGGTVGFDLAAVVLLGTAYGLVFGWLGTALRGRPRVGPPVGQVDR